MVFWSQKARDDVGPGGWYGPMQGDGSCRQPPKLSVTSKLHNNHSCLSYSDYMHTTRCTVYAQHVLENPSIVRRIPNKMVRPHCPNKATAAKMQPLPVRCEAPPSLCSLMAGIACCCCPFLLLSLIISTLLTTLAFRCKLLRRLHALPYRARSNTQSSSPCTQDSQYM
jgi:hypothetical protein